MHGKRTKLYKKRQQLLNLGPGALELLTQITHPEPRQSAERLEQLFALLEQYGDDDFRKAIDVALPNQACSVAGVRRGLLSLAARKADSAQLTLKSRGEP